MAGPTASTVADDSRRPLSPRSPRRDARRRTEDLLEAAFRALVAVFGPGGEVGPRLFFLYLRAGGKDKDPRPAFMARFLDCLDDDIGDPIDGPAVLKGSRSRRAGGFVTDRRTGRMGVVLRVRAVRWRGDAAATVNAEWAIHARRAKAVSLRMVLRDGAWIVTGQKTRWER